MNFIYLLIIFNIYIQNVSVDQICNIFAPKGEFNGIQIYYARDLDLNHQKLIMYKTGPNGGEWEVRLSENRTALEFINNTLNIKCCAEHLNRFVIQHYSKIPGTTIDHYIRLVCHIIYAVSIVRYQYECLEYDPEYNITLY